VQQRELLRRPSAAPWLVTPADHFRGVDVAFCPDNAKLAVAGSHLRIYRMSELGAAHP
jgi:hypothetical protein